MSRLNCNTDVYDRHDPTAEGAIVMMEPGPEYHKKYNKRYDIELPACEQKLTFSFRSAPVVPVVIDPVLGRKLRPHQIEGVKFMYECVMGMRGHDGKGCILADEM